MLRIGICDDSADARDALRIQLEKILNEEKEQIVYEFSAGADFFQKMINLRPNAQTIRKALRLHRHNHELLKINGVGRMSAAV